MEESSSWSFPLVLMNCKNIPESAIPCLLISMLVCFFEVSIFLISLLLKDNDNTGVVNCCQLHYQKKSKNEIIPHKGRFHSLGIKNREVMKCTRGLYSCEPKNQNCIWAKVVQSEFCSLMIKYLFLNYSINLQEQKLTNGPEKWFGLSGRRKMSLPPGQGICYSV